MEPKSHLKRYEGEKMHFRLFVLVNAKNSKDARSCAFQYLGRNGFAGNSSNSVGDWFVIGGRWSGELTMLRLNQTILKMFEEMFENEYGWYTNKDTSDEQRREQAKEMFSLFFPDFKGECPYWRNHYAHGGYDDDAELLTQEMYDLLKTRSNNDFFDGNGLIIQKKSKRAKNIELTPDLIGKMWLVVADFHS